LDTLQQTRCLADEYFCAFKVEDSEVLNYSSKVFPCFPQPMTRRRSDPIGGTLCRSVLAELGLAHASHGHWDGVHEEGLDHAQGP